MPEAFTSYAVVNSDYSPIPSSTFGSVDISDVPLNSGNIIADLPSQHQPGNLVVDLPSQQQPIVPVNTHSMTTRAKHGIYRPKVWLAVHEESKPSTVQEALSDPKCSSNGMLMFAEKKTFAMKSLNNWTAEKKTYILPILFHISLMERPCFLKCASMSFVMYCVFAMSFLAIEATTNITTDQSSLLALKAHITNDHHNLLANNWTSSTSVCNWVGITCDSQNN
ncbi:hypothetical protein EZV62_026933 [Acer yangbiense]|uniref:Leucine-rich repeat-containing N-terminal plant-type domain-containing protein n=1 Tax=Acer yangbiense TaxID=1000413 RepID=A0A5C7GT30_9ROSI|nr:hypothetical protein EZV62_026933 [Acer yangbiense]